MKPVLKYCHEEDVICMPDTKLPWVVVIGGGFAGINVIKQLKNKPVQVVLFDKNNFHQFPPLFYQVATSGLEPDAISFPLRKQFSGYPNFFFRMAEVKRIIPEDNIIETSIGYATFDYLIIATGSDTNYYGLKDIEENGIGLKSITEALDIRSMVLQNLEKAVITCDDRERDVLTNFVVVGGGPAGVEIVGALAEFKRYILPNDYPELDSSLMQIYLLEAGPRLLSAMSEKASSNALKDLKGFGVDVRLNAAVKAYDGATVTLEDGTQLLAASLIWTAGVKGAFPEGIHENAIVRGNRINVNRFNRIECYENIYVIGDAAYMETEKYPHSHPMVAPVAIQQGKHLAKNILKAVENKPMKPHIIANE